MSRPRAPSGGTRRRSVFTARLVNTADDGAQPRVVDDLRAAILSGDEPPGTVIPIDAVARFFGVSPIPVREALKILQGEGLVDHVPHVGYSVAKLTFAEFCELYEVRLALDVAALRVAVGSARGSDDDIVRTEHAELDAADAASYGAASRRFHLALLAPSRMARLLHMYEGAWNMTEAAQPMARVSRDARSALCADHDELLAAFLARDTPALIRAAHEHYEHIRAQIAAFRDDDTVFRVVR